MWGWCLCLVRDLCLCIPFKLASTRTSGEPARARYMYWHSLAHSTTVERVSRPHHRQQTLRVSYHRPHTRPTLAYAPPSRAQHCLPYRTLADACNGRQLVRSRTSTQKQGTGHQRAKQTGRCQLGTKKRKNGWLRGFAGDLLLFAPTSFLDSAVTRLFTLCTLSRVYSYCKAALSVHTRGGQRRTFAGGCSAQAPKHVTDVCMHC